MKAMFNKILFSLRRLHTRSVQTRSRYVEKLRLLQTQPRANGDPFDAQHIEPFGFTGHAPDGSEHLLLSFGGNRSHTIVLMAHNEQYRLTVAEGECAIYNTNGDYVQLKNSGEIEVKSSLRVVLDAPETLVKQDLHVEGDSVFDGSMMNAGKPVDSTHTHSDVQAGTSDSGAVS